MSADDDGLLGGLPRERPGRRSAKRESGKADGTKAKRSSRPKQTTRPKQATKPKRAAQPKQVPPSARTRPAPGPRAKPASDDPLSGVVRAARKTAETGFKTAEDVARGIIRRLPRP